MTSELQNAIVISRTLKYPQDRGATLMSNTREAAESPRPCVKGICRRRKCRRQAASWLFRRKPCNCHHAFVMESYRQTRMLHM